MKNCVIYVLKNQNLDSFKGAFEVTEKEEFNRVVLKATGGTKVSFYASGKHEEGSYSQWTECYESTDDNGNPIWKIKEGESSRDCDGVVTYEWKGVSTGETDGQGYFTDASVFIESQRYQRDLYAEMAGY